MLRILLTIGLCLGVVMPGTSFAQEKELTVNALLDRLEHNEGVINTRTIYDNDIQIFDVNKPDSSTLINETVLSLDVEDASLNDVLDIISDQTGLVFISPEADSHRISIFIEDIHVWDLLKIILQHCDLAYYRTNGAVHIMPADIFIDRYGYSFPIPFPTAMVRVEYANLEALITLLNVEKSDEGQIWLDSKNRQVLMIDSFEKLQELKRIIERKNVPRLTKEFTLENMTYAQIENDIRKALTEGVGEVKALNRNDKQFVVKDTEEKLALITAIVAEKDKVVTVPFRVKIMRIDLNEEYMDGVDWAAILTDHQEYVLLSRNGIVGAQEEKIDLGTVTNEDYEVLIEALDTVGDVTLLLSFDIDPVSGKEMVVELETNDPFWSLRSGAKKGQAGSATLDPQGFEMRTNFTVKQDAEDLIVTMLPRLYWMGQEEQNMIFMAEEGAQVKLKNNNVLVVGGLIRTEEFDRTLKVPLLGDIPMVGTVFRRQRTRFENTEYIVFFELKNDNEAVK